MRWLVLAILGTAIVAGPAAASSSRPGELVLQQVDVPRGYEYDKDNSLAMPRPPRGDSDASSRRLVRDGFQYGSIVRYTTWSPRWRYINSFAFVFKTQAGASSSFDWLDHGGRARAPRPVRRGGLALGAEARLYSYAGSDPGTLVLWRRGRVVAAVSCHEMQNHYALARSLARVQDRRVAAALR